MTTHQLRGALGAALIGLTLVTMTAAQAQAVEDPIVKLVSGQNGKCLQPVNGATDAGEAVVQTTCNGLDTQQWSVHFVSGTKVHLVNRHSGMCMDARGKGVNGTPIQQWPCNWISNENWNFGYRGNQLVSVVSDSPYTHCVATPGYNDGLAMQLRQCSSDSSQIWNQIPG